MQLGNSTSLNGVNLQQTLDTTDNRLDALESLVNGGVTGAIQQPFARTNLSGGAVGIQAKLEKGDLAFIAETAGAEGNNIAIELLDPNVANSALSANLVQESVSNWLISVSLGTDAEGDLTSDAKSIKDLLNNDSAIKVLIQTLILGIKPYVHPDTHSADMITESETRIWFTPTLLSTLNNKQDKPGSGSFENTNNKNIAHGYVGLDNNTLIETKYIPSLSYIPRNYIPIHLNTKNIVQSSFSVQSLTGGTVTSKASYSRNNLKFEAVAVGTAGNNISIRFVAGTPNQTLSANIVGDAITVNMATDAVGTPTSKAGEIQNLLNNTSAIASKIVTTLVDTSVYYDKVAPLDNNTLIPYDFLPVATTTNRGAIRIGETLVMDENGVMNVKPEVLMPSSISAGIITQDATHRFVTDVQIAKWDDAEQSLGYTPVNKAGDTILGDFYMKENAYFGGDIYRTAITKTGNVVFDNLQHGENKYPSAGRGLVWQIDNDSAGLQVVGRGLEQLDYVFYMADDVKSGDRFLWKNNSKLGKHSALDSMELYGGSLLRVSNRVDIHGGLHLKTPSLAVQKLPSRLVPSGTAQDVTIIRNNSDYYDADLQGSTLNITVDVSGYGGSEIESFLIKIKSSASNPNTFCWGHGSHDASVTDNTKWIGYSLPLSTDWINLDNGVKIKFNAVTGGVDNETFGFTVLPGGSITVEGVVDNTFGGRVLATAFLEGGTLLSDKYSAKVHTHPATDFVLGEDGMLVSQVEKSYWNAKQDKPTTTAENGTTIPDAFEVVSKKGKALGYAGLDDNAKVPLVHLPDLSYVKLADRGLVGGWVDLENVGTVQAPIPKIADTYLSVASASKLGVVKIGANITIADGVISVSAPYVHPAKHNPSDIATDESNRFVTDVQMASWSGKQNNLGFVPENSALKDLAGGYVGISVAGKMSVNFIPDLSATYVATNLKNVATGWAELDSNVKIPTTYLYTASASQLGLVKIGANIAVDANGVISVAAPYVHPSNHPATMITEDTTHKFVTDAQITAWTGKQDALGYSPVNKAGDTMSGALTVTSGNCAIMLKAGATSDHVYLGFYADSQAQNTRSGYIGYGGVGTSHMYVNNEMAGGTLYLLTAGNGDIAINPNGTGKAMVNSKEIWTTGNFTPGNYYTKTESNGLLDKKASIEQSASTNTTVIGWHRIGSNPGNRAFARFVIRETQSSSHQTVEFIAGVHYGANPFINVLANGYYSGNGAFSKIRVVEGGTYDPVYLEVYVDRAGVGGCIAFAYHDVQSAGWTVENWVAVPDAVDAGYTATEILLDSTRGFNSTAEAYFANGKKAWHSGNFDPNSKQNALGYVPVNKAGDTMTGTLSISLSNTNVPFSITNAYGKFQMLPWTDGYDYIQSQQKLKVSGLGNTDLAEIYLRATSVKVMDNEVWTAGNLTPSDYLKRSTGGDMSGHINMKNSSYLRTYHPTTDDWFFMNWFNDKPRLRIGGNGVNNDATFEIQGASDVVRMSLDRDGNADYRGYLTFGTHGYLGVEAGVVAGRDVVIKQNEGSIRTELRLLDGGSTNDVGILVRGSGDSGSSWSNILKTTDSEFTYKGANVWTTGNFDPNLKFDKVGGVISGNVEVYKDDLPANTDGYSTSISMKVRRKYSSWDDGQGIRNNVMYSSSMYINDSGNATWRRSYNINGGAESIAGELQITSSGVDGLLFNNQKVWNAGNFTPSNYILVSTRGVANGVATLDATGIIPLTQLPSSVKESRVVANLAARDAIADKFESLRVHVLDATGDATVTSGWAEYIWYLDPSKIGESGYTGEWKKTAEKEGLDVVVKWGDITEKPTDLIRGNNGDQTINANLTVTGDITVGGNDLKFGTESDGFRIANEQGTYWQRFRATDTPDVTDATFVMEERQGSGGYTELMSVTGQGVVKSEGIETRSKGIKIENFELVKNTALNALELRLF